MFQFEPRAKTIVLLRTSSTARIPVYQELQALGYDLVMIHPVTTKDFSPYFKHWIRCETNDPVPVEIKLRKAMKQYNFTPDAIMSFDEYGVYTAACLSESFGKRPLPLGPEGLRNTTIKSNFRTWCKKHQIGSPKSAKLKDSKQDVTSSVSHLNFPVVCKPSPGTGSMLIKRCESLEDLVAVVPSMWNELIGHPALIHLETLGTKIHLLVEESIGGQEVDVDCVIAWMVAKGATAAEAQDEIEKLTKATDIQLYEACILSCDNHDGC